MLAAREFTVGNIGLACPLTLVLARQPDDPVMLVGKTENGPAVVFISGNHTFEWFQSEGNTSWHGILVPGVRVEVDPESAYSPSLVDTKLGSALRTGTQLALVAKAGSILNRWAPITLEDELPAATAETAGFSRWQVVLGSGEHRRILHETSIGVR